VHPQQTADRALNLEKRRHNLPPCLQDGTNDLRLGRLHVHRTVVADTHHLGDAARVVPVGLHRSGGQEALRVAGLNADRLESGGHQVTVQPFRQRAGLQADHVYFVPPRPKLLNEWTRFAVYLALPDELTMEVQHTNCNLLQGDVEANGFAHDALRFKGDGR
jgi:hypothetical protein